MVKRLKMQTKGKRRGGRRFEVGNPGRPVGCVNKVPQAIKLALAEAMRLYGTDGKGTGGMVGYFHRLCGKHPALIAAIVQKILPGRVHGAGAEP
jgi:hypothetical protein